MCFAQPLRCLSSQREIPRFRRAALWPQPVSPPEAFASAARTERPGERGRAREEEEPPLPGSAAGAGICVRVISVNILFCHFIFVFYLRYGVKRSLASSAVTGS